MRSFLSVAFATTSLLAVQVTATPLEWLDLGNSSLFRKSDCANPCGYYGQVCCGSADACYTDSNDQAQCSSTYAAATTAAAATGGSWQYYTTTYVETDTETYTSVWSSWVATSTSSTTCDWASGESSCGSACCSAGEFCMTSGHCASIATTSSEGAAARGTSATTVTATSTASVTTTEAFTTPVSTDGSSLVGASVTNSGLSGGAIAGIVIGVLLGLLLLILLLLCCCFKEALEGLLGLLGLGGRNRRRVEETYIEEHHSSRRHGSDYRPERRTWFGRPARVEREKKHSGLESAAKVGAGLGALALILGLKRRRDDKYEDKTNSSYFTGTESGSYSYTETVTSDSSESSDRRTRDSRRSHSRR